MILTGDQIKLEKEYGNIKIDPFNKKQLNPNSYDVLLHNELSIYSLKDRNCLDVKEKNKTRSIIIPEDGYVLRPGILYLGRTVEYTETKNHVPMIEGISSLGRLGIDIHATAGFGDVGFVGYWTLEISCIHRVKVYPGMRIGQIYYLAVRGEIKQKYEGKYQYNKGIQASKMFEDFEGVK